MTDEKPITSKFNKAKPSHSSAIAAMQDGELQVHNMLNQNTYR
jgi:hypothetical protein